MIHVVYSVATGRVRRWVVGTAANNVNTVDGEALLSIGIADYGDLHKIQTRVTAYCGKTPVNDRFVVVDAKGDVVGSVIADLACSDAIPGHQLVKHASAVEGWKLVDGALVEPAKPNLLTGK